MPVRGPGRRRGTQGQPVQAGRERARGQRAVHRRAADGHPQGLRPGRRPPRGRTRPAPGRCWVGRRTGRPGSPRTRRTVASPSTRHSRGPVDSTYSTVGSDGAAASPRLSSEARCTSVVTPVRSTRVNGPARPLSLRHSPRTAAGVAAPADRHPQPVPGRGAHPGQVGHVHPAAAAGAEQRVPGGHGDQAPRLGGRPGGRVEPVQAWRSSRRSPRTGRPDRPRTRTRPGRAAPDSRRRAGRRAPTGRCRGPAGRRAPARWRAGSRPRRSSASTPRSLGVPVGSGSPVPAQTSSWAGSPPASKRTCRAPMASVVDDGASLVTSPPSV